MVCKEKVARMTGMHPDAVGPSHLDHHSHATAGHVPGVDGAAEHKVEKMLGRKI